MTASIVFLYLYPYLYLYPHLYLYLFLYLYSLIKKLDQLLMSSKSFKFVVSKNKI